MAKESGRDKSPGELTSEIVRTREQLAGNLQRVRDDLDIPRKVRRSFRAQPILWIGGVIVIGAALTLLPRRGKRDKFPTMASATAQNKFVAMSLALAGLRVAANVLRPVVTNFVERKFNSQSDRQNAARDHWAGRV